MNQGYVRRVKNPLIVGIQGVYSVAFWKFQYTETQLVALAIQTETNVRSPLEQMKIKWPRPIARMML